MRMVEVRDSLMYHTEQTEHRPNHFSEKPLPGFPATCSQPAEGGHITVLPFSKVPFSTDF